MSNAPENVAAHAAGYAQGAADARNQQSSAEPAEYAGNADYAAGYADGVAQTSDPQAYAEGEAAGRADTVQHHSSAPPAAYDPQTHNDYPGTPADSYEHGYEAGAAAPPYQSDLDAQARAEQEAREGAQRQAAQGDFVNAHPTFDPSNMSTTPQTTMSPISKEEEEADERYTEQREANERFLHLRDERQDELSRTTREDVEPEPPTVITE